MSKRWLLILVFILTSAVLAYAQTTRDYAVKDLAIDISEDETSFAVSFIVENQGLDATRAVDVIITLVSTNEPLSSGRIDPLPAGNFVTVRTPPIDLSAYEPGSEQIVRVIVGLDSIEAQGTTIAENNVETVRFNVPGAPPITSTSTPQGNNNDASDADATSDDAGDLIEPVTIDEPQPITPANTPFFAFEDGIVTLLGQDYTQEEAALGAGIAVGVLILLWLLSIVLRLIFNRPPRFGTWQAPYSMMQAYNQNTDEGRRQAWQQHAQNCLLLTPPTEGNVAALKILTGQQGNFLNNWKVTGIRLSQYDQYGRIARTQMIAQRKWIKRLNNAIHKRDRLTQEKLLKSVKGIARGLVKQFRKGVNKKTAFLHIALDLRFEGQHGEVRIWFMLYQAQGNQWFLLDQWEPTMHRVGTRLQENYTYTIHGRGNGEKINDFYSRLQEDITWLLMETLATAEPEPHTPDQTPQPREAFDIPDTLTGMEPIHESTSEVG